MNKLLWRIRRFFNPYQNIIYYDPNINRFFQEKYAQDNGLICGGFTTYHADARTNAQRQVLSYDYVSKCKVVSCIDKFPEAELCPIVKAWKVKGER